MATRKKTPANAQVSIGKLQLEILNKTRLLFDRFEDVTSQFDKVKAGVEEIKENFAYGIQEEEVRVSEDKQKLRDEYEALKLEIDQQRANSEEAWQTKLDGLKQQVVSQREINNKELEQLRYEHNLAIRDQSLSTAANIASKHGKSLVDTNEWTELENIKRTNKEELESAITEAKTSTERDITRKYEIKLSKADSAHKSEVSLLKKELEFSNKEIASLEATIRELKEQVKGNIETINEMVNNITRKAPVVKQG